jgi:hypothetical protein
MKETKDVPTKLNMMHISKIPYVPSYVPKTIWQPIGLNTLTAFAKTAECYKELSKKVTPNTFFMLCALSSLSNKERIYDNTQYVFSELGDHTTRRELYLSLHKEKLVRRVTPRTEPGVRMKKINGVPAVSTILIKKLYTDPINESNSWKLFIATYKQLEPTKLLFLCELVRTRSSLAMSYNAILQNTSHICTAQKADEILKELIDSQYLLKFYKGDYVVDENKINEIKLYAEVKH